MKLPTPKQLVEANWDQVSSTINVEKIARDAYEAVEKALRADAADREMRYLEAGAYLRVADAIRDALGRET